MGSFEVNFVHIKICLGENITILISIKCTLLYKATVFVLPKPCLGLFMLR